MGLLVLDEVFDCWNRGKTSGDYHLLFVDWHEQTFARGFVATAITRALFSGVSETKSPTNPTLQVAHVWRRS